MGQLVNYVEGVVLTQELRIDVEITKVEPIQLVDCLRQLGLFQAVGRQEFFSNDCTVCRFYVVKSILRCKR